MSALTFEPGNIWVVSHRCYNNKPLLNDPVDRRRWMYWLFQARRRFGFSVLNYVVLPNHVKLLIMDRRRGEIRCSLRLLAERMSDDYLSRHRCHTALWQNEYQASMLELGSSGLRHCITDMDLSVVRAKLVAHPNLWPEGGYHELLNPPKRARRIDFTALQRLLNPIDFTRLQRQRQRWVKQAIKLAESDAVYVPHASVFSHDFQVRKDQSLTLPMNTQQNYFHQPVIPAARELVPKRYST